MTTLALSLKTKSFLKFNPFAELLKLLKAVSHEVAMQRAITELNNLSDRQLADLGIARSEIVKRVRNI